MRLVSFAHNDTEFVVNIDKIHSITPPHGGDENTMIWTGPGGYNYIETTEPYQDVIRKVECASSGIIHCKECIYWRDKHVLLPDGTRRAYLPNERNENGFEYVPTSIGINVYPQCTRDQRYSIDEGIIVQPVFRNEDDFCSKAHKGKPQFGGNRE